MSKGRAALTKGSRIEIPVADGAPVFASAGWLAELALARNALCNLQIKEGNTDPRFEIADGNAVLTLRKPVSGGDTGEAVNVKLFTITALAANSMTGNEVGGGLVGVTINKPPALRNSVSSFIYNGITYNCGYTTFQQRTLTSTVVGWPVETQTVEPGYIVGQIVLGVEIASSWYDANMDGRHWEFIRRETPVCDPVNGTTKYCMIARSLYYTNRMTSGTIV